MNDAKLLESAGVFSIVLECVETSLSKQITKILKIPTIGIGSSVYCDGQVLVTDDGYEVLSKYPYEENMILNLMKLYQCNHQNQFLKAFQKTQKCHLINPC